MRARAAAAIALSGALALGLAGCNFVTPPATTDPYFPSDGTNVDVADLQLRNVLIVTEDGELGSLVATAVNTTDADIEFTFQWEVDGDWHEIELVAEAGGSTVFGPEGESVQIDEVGALPGDGVDAVVQAGGEQKGFFVPVLDGTLPEYVPAIPTPTPTPEPEETTEPEPSETPAADEEETEEN